jgi:hypothetical protein
VSKKKKRRKKKTMKKNMMKMKWLYSSRNPTSSSREEDLTKEKEKRSQCQRGCATIVARMGISLHNEHMRGSKKAMTKKKKFAKGYKKDKKYTKKKPYDQAHIGQEWNSSDESFELSYPILR